MNCDSKAAGGKDLRRNHALRRSRSDDDEDYDDVGDEGEDVDDTTMMMMTMDVGRRREEKEEDDDDGISRVKSLPVLLKKHNVYFGKFIISRK